MFSSLYISYSHLCRAIKLAAIILLLRSSLTPLDFTISNLIVALPLSLSLLHLLVVTGSERSLTIFRCLATCFVSLHFSRTNRRLRGRMLEQCRAQGQRRGREVSVCWPTASASDIINFFARLPRTRLGYIMVRPDCTLRSVCSLKIKCLKSFCTKPRLRGQSTSLRFWLRLHRLALFFALPGQHQHPRGVY